MFFFFLFIFVRFLLTSVCVLCFCWYMVTVSMMRYCRRFVPVMGSQEIVGVIDEEGDMLGIRECSDAAEQDHL